METCDDACYNFNAPVPYSHFQDSALFSTLFVLIIYYGWYLRRATVKADTEFKLAKMSKFDRLLSWSFLMVFLVEIVFKYLSNQLMFLLQPCHVVTSLQLYSLFTRSRHAEFVFNLSLFWLWGPYVSSLRRGLLLCSVCSVCSATCA